MKHVIQVTLLHVKPRILLSMKHKGGRGLKSENKYHRLTATVPPDVLAVLDRYAEVKGVSRSEALSLIVQRHQKVWAVKLD